MKVFISWSGDRSRELAEGLRSWLPVVLQAAEPWTSSTDLQAGANWVKEIEFQLRETRVGVVCLTPENLRAPWVLHETGALWARGSIVIPYLLGFDPPELIGPLAQFQAVRASRDGTWKLVITLNRLLEERAVDEPILREAFDRSWNVLERVINEIGPYETDRIHAGEGRTGRTGEGSRRPPAERTEREMLEEILRQVSGSPKTVNRGQPDSADRFVFVVHGHDHGVKEAVARFIEKLGAKVVVLHEQSDRGQTVIEKFEHHSDVSYAVVLLTADDRGGQRSASYEEQRPRARQNVILELGFFLAQLGRSRVGVIHEPGVEIPSDYSGVLYIPLDEAGAWRFLLARELRAAGLDVDLNRAL